MNKNDCKEVDDNGNILSVLMCYISIKGLTLPEEILKEIKKNKNTVFYIQWDMPILFLVLRNFDQYQSDGKLYHISLLM